MYKMMRSPICAASTLLGAGALAAPGEPAQVPLRELTPVVTSIVVTAPYGQPPEIRITISSPYAGARVTTESHVTGDHFPPVAPSPAPQPQPQPERRPFATIGEPAGDVANVAPPARPVAGTPAPAPRPASPAARAAKSEAPYRRIPTP